MFRHLKHLILDRRTRGDGQEKENRDLPESKFDLNSAASSSTVETASHSSDSKIAKFLPKGKIYNLVPKLVGSPTNQVGMSINKPKEPRFVPYEPYKAAVTPMSSSNTPKKPKKTFNSKEARNRGNIDVNVLAGQLTANVHNLSISCEPRNTEQNNRPVSDWELMYNDMRKEKEYAEKQLKFQIQVNSELKNLLIAAVGEDLNDRVNVLTEDKLTLARALLDSSNDLSSHSEQIEYLAGQCEVWRSKFLASSLMLEELARWKTTLLEKNKHLVASNKAMLLTMAQLREMQAEQLKNLRFVVKRPSEDAALPSANVTDLAMEGVNISQQLALVNSATMGVPKDLKLDGLDHLTTAEKSAKEAIQITEMNLIRTDDPFRAIVTHAFPTITALREERERVMEKVGESEQQTLPHQNHFDRTHAQ